jgi:hypothetical protein
MIYNYRKDIERFEVFFGQSLPMSKVLIEKFFPGDSLMLNDDNEWLGIITTEAHWVAFMEARIMHGGGGKLEKELEDFLLFAVQCDEDTKIIKPPGFDVWVNPQHPKFVL